MKKSKITFLIAELFLVVIAGFFIHQIFRENVPQKRVAVILSNSGDKRWDGLINGLKQSPEGLPRLRVRRERPPRPARPRAEAQAFARARPQVSDSLWPHKENKYNTVKVVENIQHKLVELRKSMPGYEFSIISNQGAMILCAVSSSAIFFSHLRPA